MSVLKKELKELRAKVSKAGKEGSAAFKQMQDGVDELTHSVPGLGTALQTLANPAVGIAATAGAIALIAKNVHDANLELRPFVERSQLAAGELEVLRRQAERLGSEDGLEGVTDVLQEFSLRAAEFQATGAGPAADAIKALGLNIEELLALPAKERFIELVGVLQDMEDQAERTFRADELFGGSWERIAGVVNESRPAFEAAVANMQGLEEATTKAYNASLKFDENVRKIQDGIDTAVVNSLGAAFDYVATRMDIAEQIERRQQETGKGSAIIRRELEQEARNLNMTLEAYIQLVKDVVETQHAETDGLNDLAEEVDRTGLAYHNLTDELSMLDETLANPDAYAEAQRQLEKTAQKADTLREALDLARLAYLKMGSESDHLYSGALVDQALAPYRPGTGPGLADQTFEELAGIDDVEPDAVFTSRAAQDALRLRTAQDEIRRGNQRRTIARRAAAQAAAGGREAAPGLTPLQQATRAYTQGMERLALSTNQAIENAQNTLDELPALVERQKSQRAAFNRELAADVREQLADIDAEFGRRGHEGREGSRFDALQQRFEGPLTGQFARIDRGRDAARGRATRRLNRQLQDLAEQHQDKLADIQRNGQRARLEAIEDFGQKAADIQRRSQWGREDLQREFDREIAKLSDDDALGRIALAEQLALDLEDLDRDERRALEENNIQRGRALADIEQETQQRLADERTDYRERVETAEADHQYALEEADRAHKEAMALAQALYEQALTELQTTALAEREAAVAKVAATAAEKKKAFEAGLQNDLLKIQTTAQNNRLSALDRYVKQAEAYALRYKQALENAGVDPTGPLPTIPEYTPPELNGGGNGNTIPVLDSGGIAMQRQLAMLAANNRPEVVMPLAELPRLLAQLPATMGGDYRDGGGKAPTIQIGTLYGFNDFVRNVARANYELERRGYN